MTTPAPRSGAAKGGPGSDLRERVLAAARQTPSPNRAEVMRTTRWLALTAVAGALGAFWALGGFRFGSRPLGFIALVAVGWGAVAVLVTSLAFARGRSISPLAGDAGDASDAPLGLGPTRRLLLTVAMLTAPILFGWAVMCTAAWPEVRTPEGTWSAHLSCFASTATLGFLPLVALILARRRSDPVHPRATGAVLGAAMGAWGGTLMDLHCNCASVPHIAFSHTLPTLVLALLAALVAPRILAI